MNFTELYQRIRSIDEGTASEPTAPGGVIKTKNADGSVSYKPKVPGERLTSTLPSTQAAKTTDTSDKDKAKAVNEECGDMPVGMMGMSSPQGQQDSVTMNISMNGSGAGGIRDLMSILRNIESSDNADVHSHDVGQMFGGNDIEVAFDEEMSDGGFGAASTTPDPTVSGIDAVTDIGAPINGGDHRKRQAGLPQGVPMHETLVDRLSALYNEIKEAKEEEFDALKHVKNPTKGEKEAAKDVKRGSYADRADMLKSAEADGRLKEGERTMSRAAKGYEKYGKKGMMALAKAGREGKDLEPIQDKFNKYDESAKWRDPKHKDKLYTQEPRSDEDDYYGDDDYYNPKPDDYPGAKNIKGGGEYDHNDPLRKGYGRHGTGSMNTHGKRKGMPSRDQISSLKGSIKAAHGTHPRPNLPK